MTIGEWVWRHRFLIFFTVGLMIGMVCRYGRMPDHTLLVLCIPVALAAGLLWGIAWEKHRASHRRAEDSGEAAQRRHVEAVTRRAVLRAERQTDNERPIRSRPF